MKLVIYSPVVEFKTLILDLFNVVVLVCDFLCYNILVKYIRINEYDIK